MTVLMFLWEQTILFCRNVVPLSMFVAFFMLVIGTTVFYHAVFIFIALGIVVDDALLL